MSDLIERLCAMCSHRGDGIPTQYVNPDGPEAADRIEAQQAEIERLREALEGAHKWLSGWASAEPYLSIIEQALNGDTGQ